MHRWHAKSAQKNVSETLSWRANNAPKHIKTHQTPAITQKNASKSCRNTQNRADSVFDIFRSTFVQHSRFLFRKSAGRGCFLRKTPFLLASVEIGIFFAFGRRERAARERGRGACFSFSLTRLSSDGILPQHSPFRPARRRGNASGISKTPQRREKHQSKSANEAVKAQNAKRFL